MLVMIAVIGALHYVTPGHYILWHDTFRRLAYFPIAIGAILYGLPGGISTAVLACVFFVPHLLVFWYQGPQTYYSELSEIVFYLAAGVVIGFISSRWDLKNPSGPISGLLRLPTWISRSRLLLVPSEAICFTACP